MKRLSVFVFLFAVALSAFGEAPFAAGAAQLPAQFIAFVRPIAGLAIIGVGIAAMCRVLHWGMAISIILGMVIALGYQQVYDWITSLFGVY